MNNENYDSDQEKYSKYDEWDDEDWNEPRQKVRKFKERRAQ